MKISILLPYKENFTEMSAGAVSLHINDITRISKYINEIMIYGDTPQKERLLPNFKHLETNNKFYLSKSNAYIDEFIKNEKKNNSNIIEVHNRPTYINRIYKQTKSKIILYFHNDPLSMRGSNTASDRLKLLKISHAIVFNSNWCKKRFLYNLASFSDSNKLLTIYQSTSKTKINFKEKKKIISFVGKLNASKGYDIFGKSIIRILDEFKDWSSIVIGDEPRQKFFFKHSRLKLLGYKKNSYILRKLKKVSISVVPSKWDEPFGRSSLEASSRGCALIISDKGGLKETTNSAILLKSLDKNELYQNIKKLIQNESYRKKIQRNTYKNFYLTNKFITKKIDLLRSELLNINYIKNKKCLKILHVTNLNERFDGRLHYNTGKRLNNGFIRLGHNVLTISDRDIIKSSKTLTDPAGIKSLNSKIIRTQLNFMADLVVLGHADNISKNTILELKKINNPKICQWFLDPVIKKGPDYKKNKKRITNFDSLIDATFLTTHPDAIKFKIYNSFFIPNPCDISFETLNNSINNPKKDLFFAMSHGVHRGVLKDGKYDAREQFLNKIKKKTLNIDFDIFGMQKIQPIWGDDFLNKIKNYKMALNLSRGEPVKYYSSDRIVQLIANGLLTFIDKKTKLNEILSSKGVVYYNGVNDLINKINYYKNNPLKIKKIASIGKKEYIQKFNSNLVCQFIIDKTFKSISKKKYVWD